MSFIETPDILKMTLRRNWGEIVFFKINLLTKILHLDFIFSDFFGICEAFWKLDILEDAKNIHFSYGITGEPSILLN